MKKFTFPLEAILNLKIREADLARQKLGKAVSQSNRLQKEIDQNQQLVSSLGIGASLQDIQAVELYKNRLSRTIINLKKEWLDNNDHIQSAREDYVNALAKVKIYEKMKEKRKNDYNKAVQKAEIKRLDEMNQNFTGLKEISYEH